MSVLASLIVLIEDEPPSEMKQLIDDAGPTAMLFVVLLGVALFLLWKSMNRQMKKIDPNLPAGPDDREQADDRAIIEQAVERGTDDAPGR